MKATVGHLLRTNCRHMSNTIGKFTAQNDDKTRINMSSFNIRQKNLTHKG
jgi:hypothetical protein